MSETKIDYLTEDKPIENQKFFCVSFLSPEGIKNCTLRGLKFRGAFATYEEAKAYADKLQKDDPYFHIFVGESGKWLPWDPSPDTAKESQYAEPQLQELAKQYMENREKAARAEKERKQDLFRKSLNTSVKDKDALARERLRLKLEEKRKQVQQEKENRERLENNKKESLENNKKDNFDDNKNKLNSLSDDVKKNENELNNVQSNIDKLKSMYASLISRKENKETN